MLKLEHKDQDLQVLHTTGSLVVVEVGMDILVVQIMLMVLVVINLLHQFLPTVDLLISTTMLVQVMVQMLLREHLNLEQQATITPLWHKVPIHLLVLVVEEEQEQVVLGT